MLPNGPKDAQNSDYYFACDLFSVFRYVYYIFSVSWLMMYKTMFFIFLLNLPEWGPEDR